MPADPSQEPVSHPFGTTMRIDITPELLDEAKRGQAKRETGKQEIIRIPKPRSASTAGGVDFQQLLQNIYDAAFITELDGDIVMANIRANQFFIAQPGQLAHQNILSLICGADDNLLPTILETLKNNRFVLMQAYCRRMDETFFPTEISVNRLRLANKDRLSFFVRDVTLRKEQEERLRTGNTAIQNASSGIAVTDLTGEIEFSNPAFLAFFSLRELSHLEGRNLRDFLREPGEADAILESVQRNETWEGELELVRSDRSTFFGRTSVTPNFNTDGEQVGMVLSILDITPQKQAQQQLEAYADELHRKNTQMQEDLNVAGELHEALLPTDFQTFPRGASSVETRLQIRHLYLPSGTIGGDFFDIRQVSPTKAAVFIADVMGHGIRSALVVATIRGLFEELRPIAENPGALLTQLNSNYTAIFKQMGSDVTFATAFYAVIDTSTSQMLYANASHPAPYVLREERAEQLEVSSDAGVAALGLFSGSRYGTRECALNSGDMLLLYTDGIAETESASGELYEAARFATVLDRNRRARLEDLLQTLVSDARDFSAFGNFEDDVCLLGVRVTPHPQPDE